MKFRTRIFFLVFSLICGFYVYKSPDFVLAQTLPAISEIIPTQVRVGNTMIIQGTDFGAYSEGTLTDPNPDINHDGKVNLLDLTILAQHYRAREGDEKYNKFADINRNGEVTISDLAMLAEQWNKKRGSSYVTFTNGLWGEIESWSASEIRIKVPFGVESGAVVIHNSGQVSEGYAYSLRPPNTGAPVVNAGADIEVKLPSDVLLNAVITDNDPFSVLWTTESGPVAAVFADPTSASTTATFTIAGTYVLKVTADDGELTSSDTLVVTVLPQYDLQGVITYGTSISASISAVNETDIYSVTAQAGDVLSIKMNKAGGSSSFYPRVRIYAVDGMLVADQYYTGTGEFLASISKTGDYYFHMSDDNLVQTGSYRLRVDRLNAADNAVEYVFGSYVNATFTSLLEAHSYHFTGQAGDALSFRLDKTSGNSLFRPRIRIYDAGGTQVINQVVTTDIAEIIVPLALGGDYYVWVSDDDLSQAGSFVFGIDRMNAPNNTAEYILGTDATAAITATLQMYSYHFTAQVGDSFLVRLDRTSGATSFRPRVRIYDAGGTQVVNQSFGDSGEILVSLAAGGNYYAWITDDDLTHGGEYVFKMDRLNHPDNFVELGFGDIIVNSTTSSVQADIYHFTAQAGDFLLIRVDQYQTSATANFNPRIRIYDSTGNLVSDRFYDNSGEHSLSITATGDYYVWATDDNFNDIGEYEFRIDRVNSPIGTVMYTLGDVISAGIVHGVKADVYHFTAQAGDVLQVNVNQLSGGATNFNPRIRIYDINANLLSDTTFDDNGQYYVSITESGDYYLWVTDNDFNEAGNYELTATRLNNLENAVPINFNETIAKVLTSAVTMNVYSFSAKNGDKIQVIVDQTGGTANFNPRIRLFDINGVALFNQGFSDNGSVDAIIPADGMYYVVVTDDNVNEAGSYTLRVNLFLITDVSSSSEFFNPVENETAALNFTLTQDSAVTIELYKAGVSIDGQGNATYYRELQGNIVDQQTYPAGINQYQWDGKLNGEIVANSAYTFAISVQDGARSDKYDPPYVSGTVSLVSGAVMPNVYNPYANEPVEIRYTLNAPAWVVLGGNQGSQVLGYIINGEPRPAGLNIEPWNGRDGLNNIIKSSFSLAAKTVIMPKIFAVVQSNSLKLTDVYSKPFVIIPSYNEQAEIHYTITSDADVVIRMIDPNGNSWTISQIPAQPAGSYVLGWEGRDAFGDIVAQNGYYRAEITAADLVSGSKVTKSINISVFK